MRPPPRVVYLLSRIFATADMTCYVIPGAKSNRYRATVAGRFALGTSDSPQVFSRVGGTLPKQGAACAEVASAACYTDGVMCGVKPSLSGFTPRMTREPLATSLFTSSGTLPAPAQQVQQVEEQVQDVQIETQSCEDVVGLAAGHDARGVVQDVAAEDQCRYGADCQLVSAG